MRVKRRQRHALLKDVRAFAPSLEVAGEWLSRARLEPREVSAAGGGVMLTWWAGRRTVVVMVDKEGAAWLYRECYDSPNPRETANFIKPAHFTDLFDSIAWLRYHRGKRE